MTEQLHEASSSLNSDPEENDLGYLSFEALSVQSILRDDSFKQRTSSQGCAPLMLELEEESANSLSIETQCMLCDDKFNLKTSLPVFLMHLIENHGLIIDEVQSIEDLTEYVKYWRNKFQSTPIDRILPTIDRAVDMGATEKTYYLLSDLTKEDKEVRHKIKLDFVVKLQEFEREDTNYKRDCLFCNLKFEGKRADYLDHLFKKHNLAIGHPQNLVYVDELIEMINTKLTDLKCIYCDKTFPERHVLKEHMRKKLHKKINRLNIEFDKFYIVNYLDPNRSWKAIQKENDRFAIEPGSTRNGDEEYGDWKEDPQIRCLFCAHKESDINVLCLHMEADHDFDFADVTEQFDFYQKTKLVNYIRKQVHELKCIFCDESFESLEALQRHMSQELHYKLPKKEVFINQPELFFPTYENDAFLYHIEDDLED